MKNICKKGMQVLSFYAKKEWDEKVTVCYHDHFMLNLHKTIYIFSLLHNHIIIPCIMSKIYIK